MIDEDYAFDRVAKIAHRKAVVNFCLGHGCDRNLWQGVERPPSR